MKSDTLKVLYSGWGLFILISLFVSAAIDWVNPGVTLVDGQRLHFLRGGSTVLGWFICFTTFLLPASLLRFLGVAPVRWWIAALLSVIGYFGWLAIHVSLNPEAQVRPSLTMIGSMIIMWRLLRHPRISTAPKKPISAKKQSVSNEAIGVAIILGEREEALDLPHKSDSPTLSQPNVVLIMWGLLFILTGFGIYGLSEDETPSLTWLLIISGIWSITVFLMPERLLKALLFRTNWPAVKMKVIYSTSLLAALVLLGFSVYFSERYFNNSGGGKSDDWQVVKIQGREYVTGDNLSQFYRFNSSTVEGPNVWFRSNNLILSAQIGSQEILINNVKLILSYPVIESNGKTLFSRLDLAKTIDPVLRPTHITDFEAFDTVVLDPAHGGEDEGSTGEFGKAKDMTLRLAEALSTELIERSFKVVLTRSADTSLSDDERIKIANDTPHSIFISLRFNSGDKQTSGIETFALTPQGSSNSEVDPENRAGSEVRHLWWLWDGIDNPDTRKPSESKTQKT